MKIIVLLLLKVSLNKHISLSLNKALMKTTIRNFFFFSVVWILRDTQQFFILLTVTYFANNKAEAQKDFKLSF